MAKVKANGIEIEYETAGNKADPALLLVMGLGAQLTIWPDALFQGLAGRGFYVIRFDNRDTGLSTGFDSWGVPNLPAAVQKVMKGEKVDAPYLLKDMAADAIGLLDALRNPARTYGPRLDGWRTSCRSSPRSIPSARARWSRSTRPAAVPACRRESPRRWPCCRRSPRDRRASSWSLTA